MSVTRKAIVLDEIRALGLRGLPLRSLRFVAIDGMCSTGTVSGASTFIRGTVRELFCGLVRFSFDKSVRVR